MKTIINILFLVLCPFVMHAQSGVQEINEIKMSPDYIYGEATLENKDESVALAKELLINNIKEWMISDPALQNVENIVVQEVVENSNIVSLMRGKMYRAFVYAKKEDIIPVRDAKNVLIVSNDAPIKAAEETVLEDSISQPDENLSSAQQETLDTIMKIEYSKDVVPIFNQLKLEKKIVFGKYSTLKSVNDCYLLIYNKYGEVVAMLDKGHLKNMHTGTEDSVKNYEGCGAVWFQLL